MEGWHSPGLSVRTSTVQLTRDWRNLQFQSFPARQSNGASGASSITAGLAAGALQDNGVVFSFAASDGTQRPWQRITVEDDGLVGVFLKNDFLLFWNNDDQKARLAKWAGDHFEPASYVTVRTKSPTVSKGSNISNPFAEPVFHPAWKSPDTNQWMFAIAAYSTANSFQDLWGLFADLDGKKSFLGLSGHGSPRSRGRHFGRRLRQWIQRSGRHDEWQDLFSRY